MKTQMAIIGAGESGTGAAILAKKQGYEVFVSDFGNIRDRYKSILDDHQIEWEEGQHSKEKLIKASEVIKSPGVPDESEIIQWMNENHIPVISEIEFAGRYTNAYKIGITGSNGKTTTTLLIYDMMKKARFDVGLAGNVGNSFAWQVAKNDFEYYVLELSSFQLDGIREFGLDIAILLNITEDHLDRYHHNMQEYIRSKFRIAQHQTTDKYFIYCYDDPNIISNLALIQGDPCMIPFSIQSEIPQGGFVSEKEIIIKHQSNTFNMALEELALKGKHNLYNSLAAGITGYVLNIRKEYIRDCLTDFQGVEHRLEPVLRVHGIEFINDSKATNVNSTWYALESMQKPVIWIAGGIDKGNDYSALYELVREKVRALVCLGKDNSRLHQAFDDKIPTVVDTVSMKEAVETAYFLGKNEQVVLLSPACASFDLFENYEDRGWQFKEAVRDL